jgi:putative phosphoesterase
MDVQEMKSGVGVPCAEESDVKNSNAREGAVMVGVLSDTHGRLPMAACAALADCDVIVHAGDICGLDILTELRSLAPVHAVLGNNDFPEYGSGVQRFAQFELAGLRFLVAHYPQDIRSALRGNGPIHPGDPLPHVCIHGHTHVPEILTGKDARPANLIVCPGSVSRPRGGSKPSIAKMEVENGRILSVRIEEI